MGRQDLASALARLDVGARELAALVEESEACARAWTTGAQPAPRWVEIMIETWLDHPQLLTIARETVAVRLDDDLPIGDDLVFRESA